MNSNTLQDYQSSSYEKPHRLYHYAHQINLINKHAPDQADILEVGVGGKFVSDHLKKYGHNVTTMDINDKLEPDIVGDIRNTDIGSNEYDVIIAAEILEHIPYADFLDVLKKLQKSTKRICLIALPYRGAYFGGTIRAKVPFVDFGFNRSLHLRVRIPYFWQVVNIDDNGSHYWELGAKGHMVWNVKKDIRQRFSIRESFSHPTTPNHHFFVLESHS